MVPTGKIDSLRLFGMLLSDVIILTVTALENHHSEQIHV